FIPPSPGGERTYRFAAIGLSLNRRRQEIVKKHRRDPSPFLVSDRSRAPGPAPPAARRGSAGPSALRPPADRSNKVFPQFASHGRSIAGRGSPALSPWAPPNSGSAMTFVHFLRCEPLRPRTWLRKTN